MRREKSANMKARLWKRGAALFLALGMTVTGIPGGTAQAQSKTMQSKTVQSKTMQSKTVQSKTMQEAGDTAADNSGKDTKSSDRSVLKALNLDVPADSSYKQDDLYTGTRGVGTMSELVVTEGGTTGRTKVYDYDKTKNNDIRDNLKEGRALIDSIARPSSNSNYGITEMIDLDGDGKKEYQVQLHLEAVRSGGEIVMSLTRMEEKEGKLESENVFWMQTTGGEIGTYSHISSWEVEGLLSMCAGDFDGDGCEEIAVYTPNNMAETPSGSTPDSLQIRIFKLRPDSTGPGEPWQTIDIARVGSKREDCQEWLYSHAGSKKRYYCIPYMQLTAGDVNGDGIDDLLTVANFSSTFRGRWLGQTMTWKQVLDPNSAFASVLDVYQGQRAEHMKQVVKKRVLVAQDSSKDKNDCCVLRNASVTIANVTGANTNEIVFGGNLTGITYSSSTKENDTVTANCCVWTDDSDDPKVVVGYVPAKTLLAEKDDKLAAALDYNWTIHDNGYNPLHYYNGDVKGKYKTGDDGSGSGDYDAACEPVNLDGFAAYGYGQPDTIALEGQLFELSTENSKLVCNAYEPPHQVGDNKSNVWLSSQTVGNVTNDTFGRETLYFTNCQKRSGKETYWNDIISVWGVVDQDGKKGYQGKSMGDGQSSGALHYSLAMCDIDDDSTYIQYEAGNTDVYYSDVQVLAVLQAPPVYDDLGDDYVGEAETSYGKSTGTSVGEGESFQVSAGIIAGFEHECSILGLQKVFSVELQAEISGTLGWEEEDTKETSFSTSYKTGGTEDAAVIYTVPYVRYNARIFVPSFKMPTEEEFYAKKSFSNELAEHLKKYKDIKAGVTGGKYAQPNDGFNNGYTTDVTADNYEYQVKTYRNYMEWLETAQSQISKECNPDADQEFHFSGTHTWGEEIEGGWEDYFYSIPQTPIITSVAVDTYEKIADNCSNLQSLYGTALPSGYRAGDPSTYADSATLRQKTTAVKDSILDGKMTFGSEDDGTKGDGFVNVTPLSSGNTSVTQSIEFTTENAKTQTKGAGFSLESTVGVGDFKAGVSFSTDYEASYTTTTTNGCTFEGTVPNLPARPAYMGDNAYDQYSFNWKLVSYDAMVNGGKVPVVGYYTKRKSDATPPSTALNLEIEDVSGKSISLVWSGGARPADHYHVYQVSGSKGAKTYEKVGTVSEPGSDGIYHFTHKDLKPEKTYTYVVGAYNENETAVSVYSDEAEAVTSPLEFDVAIKLSGIDSEETYLAGKDKTLRASLETENYPQSEIDQYIWQVNDGSGWRRLSDKTDEDSCTWNVLAGMDGYKYRCGAYVAVDNQLYRIYSEPVVLHVRKAETKMKIQADKREGAADTSSEFGLAVYTKGDVLELTAQVEAEEGSRLEGNVVFVVTENADTANVKKYPAELSENGTATAKCMFTRVGRYTITASYEENEWLKGTVSDNSLPYYAYDISQQADREQGQGMEQTIYEKEWDDLTVKNVLDKKEEITEVSTEYKDFDKKDFVDTGAKKKLETVENMLGAADTLAVIDSIADVALEDAGDKKDEIERAREDYEKLNDVQKDLLKDEGAEAKLKAAEDKVTASEAIQKITDIGTVTAENAEEKKTLIDEAERGFNALTEEQKELVPDEVKKALSDAKAAYEKAANPDDTQKETPAPDGTENKTPAPDGPQKVTPAPDSTAGPDGTENLTEEQKAEVAAIAGKLGLSTKEAVSVWELADGMGIAMDTILLTEEDILAERSEKDVKGSRFGKLRVKAAKTTTKSVKLSWKKCKGADGYFVYSAACGKKNAYEKAAEIKKGSAKTCRLNKLKKGTSYRFIVCAYKTVCGKNITISAAKTVHVVTNGSGKGNVKGIKADRSKAVLKKGKTLRLKASEIKGKKPSKKCRKLCYESDNEEIASVTKKGRVKAKAKGKCGIYIYTQNGLYKKVRITVK